MAAKPKAPRTNKADKDKPSKRQLGEKPSQIRRAERRKHLQPGYTAPPEPAPES